MSNCVHARGGAARLVGLSVVLVVSGLAQQGRFTGKIYSSDGFPLPGARVLIGDLSAVSDVNGVFNFPAVPSGAREARVRADGYRESVRTINIRADRVNLMNVALFPAAAPGGSAVFSVVNAGSNRPAYLTQSEIPRGGMFKVYGQNLGPEVLVPAPDAILSKSLGGVVAMISAKGNQYQCPMVYAGRNEFAAVMPSAVPAGEASLTVSYQNAMTSPFRIRVVEAQPNFFTWTQNGQGPAIATRADYSLITLQKPAKPGELVILWGTGGGAAPEDDRPVLHDKRLTLYDSFGIFVGGRWVPRSSIVYMGSGGYGAGDQWMFPVPENAPTGCGVQLHAYVKTPDGRTAVINPVEIPISKDGSPCEDPHGLSSSEVAGLNLNPQIRLSFGLGEVTALDGDRSTEYFWARAGAQEATSRHYEPPVAAGTCAYRWRPEGWAPVGPSLSGSLTLQVPGAAFPLNENSNSGRYNATYATTDRVADGPFTISFANNFRLGDLSLSGSYQGVYRRSLVKQLESDLRILAARARAGENVDDEALVLGAKAFLLGLAGEISWQVNDGALGTHSVICAPNGQEIATHPLEKTIHPLLPAHPADAATNLRFVDPEWNRRRWPGNIGTQVVFDRWVSFRTTHGPSFVP